MLVFSLSLITSTTNGEWRFFCKKKIVFCHEWYSLIINDVTDVIVAIVADDRKHVFGSDIWICWWTTMSAVILSQGRGLSRMFAGSLMSKVSSRLAHSTHVCLFAHISKMLLSFSLFSQCSLVLSFCITLFQFTVMALRTVQLYCSIQDAENFVNVSTFMLELNFQKLSLTVEYAFSVDLSE